LVAPAAEPTGIVGGIIVATAGALVLIFVARMFRGRGIARA
jgi:uncharacterized membrane protein YeaQ/YmgE (transglycosylase-associated protein family)